jgi:hypothetical protein
MKLTKLHLIIILALALILCPVLGVCYSSDSNVTAYNYREGLANPSSGSMNKKLPMNGTMNRTMNRTMGGPRK